MEEEPCMYSKFGFCKFKNQCKRKHYTEKCQENTPCKQQKTCPKRQPRDCKRIQQKEGCRFGDECGYNHDSVCETSKNNELKHKVIVLETTVADLHQRIVELEAKLSKCMHMKSEIDGKKETVAIPSESEEVKAHQQHKGKTDKSGKPQERDQPKDDRLDYSLEADLINDDDSKASSDLQFKCDACGYVCKKKIHIKEAFYHKT